MDTQLVVKNIMTCNVSLMWMMRAFCCNCLRANKTYP